MPENPRAAYDMHDVIGRVVDRGDFMEVQEHFAPNLIVGFARMEGSTIGVVANNPAPQGRRAGHRFLGQGRPLHPLLQRLQHSRW